MWLWLFTESEPFLKAEGMPAVAENECVSLSYMFIACMFQITMERSRNSFFSLHF